MTAPEQRVPPYEDDFVLLQLEEGPSCADDMPPPYEDIEAGLPTQPRKYGCVYCYLLCVLSFASCVMVYNYFGPYIPTAGVNVHVQCDIASAGISDDAKNLICYISREVANWNDGLADSSSASVPNYILNLISDEYMQEEIYVDLSGEISMARLEVSDFKDGRSGKFLHDFKARMSAIIDSADNRCFITPLDESLLMPPEEFLDLMQRCDSSPAFCNMGTEIIIRNVSAILMPLKDLNVLPDAITYECRGKNVYMLQVDGLHSMKRAVQQTPQLVKFVEFLGRGLVTYNLLNIAEVENLEKGLINQTYAKNSIVH